MKILFLSNNFISQPVRDYLQKIGEEVVDCDKKITKGDVVKIHPDFIISYNYRYIISNDVIRLYPNKIINLHCSFLPWNRGANPNFWSFVEKTPKGITIHYIDQGLDTGNILAQKKIIFIEERETLESTYKKLHKEMFLLFKSSWKSIKYHALQSISQSTTHQAGSFHSVADFEKIEYILNTEGWSIPIKTLRKRYASTKY